jgi:festuclavine dehydrogenase
MTILLTGGNGRTGSSIARRLHEAKIPFLVLSRSGSAPAPYAACRFDWHDKSTYEIPFSQSPEVKAIYLVLGLAVIDAKAQPVLDFIDFARGKGVTRFVALSMSNAELGERVTGAVHQYLTELPVEYVVLRPTWFMGTLTKAVVPYKHRFDTIDRKFYPWEVRLYQGNRRNVFGD